MEHAFGIRDASHICFQHAKLLVLVRENFLWQLPDPN
jgi:hypothetical protein